MAWKSYCSVAHQHPEEAQQQLCASLQNKGLVKSSAWRLRSPGCCATCPVRRARASEAINNSMLIASNMFSLCHKDNRLTDTSACSLLPPPIPTSSAWHPLPWTPGAGAAGHWDPERLGGLQPLEMLQPPAETALAGVSASRASEASRGSAKLRCSRGL